MEVKRLDLFGSTIALTQDKVNSNGIRLAFTHLEQTQRRRIANGFVELFTNLDGLYEQADLIANEIRGLAINQAMNILAANGLYEMSEQQFFDQFMDPYDTWDQDFEPIVEAYEQMLEQTAELDAHRTARRKSRAQWVGFNQSAQYNADAKNLISNIGHGVFNLMAKGVSAIGNAIKKDEIFKNPQTQALVRDGMGDIVAAAREGVIEALNSLKPGTVHLYSQGEVDRSVAVVENVKKERIPNSDVLPALLRAIETFPYNRDIYALLLQHYGADAGRLDKAVEYFGLAALETEKKKLFATRRRGVDLSTLEALEENLPSLTTYAQSIGYTAFAPEAVLLRKEAAQNAFDNRLRILADVSVAEFLAQSDKLRVYAAEIGVEGADAALAQVLIKTRLREFNQEATKYPLTLPEDCDQSLPILEEYARQIGFEGFKNWADTTRQRAADLYSKNNKQAKHLRPEGNNSKAAAKAKAQSKPSKMALGFVALAFIGFGGYQAYTHFITFTEKASVAVTIPADTAEQTALASVPLEQLSTQPEFSALPAPELTASETEAVSLRPLSLAAEQAIREGFVEIKDPTVQACTDSKIFDYRKEVGEDAMVNYALHNEFAVDCGFNIPEDPIESVVKESLPIMPFSVHAVINDVDGYTNIREAPNSKSAIVGRVESGHKFLTHPQPGDWWQVQVSANLYGYMHKSRILIQPDL